MTIELVKNKINLSNRAIELLKSDNVKRYKGYVQGDWEFDFAPSLSVGKAFASCMEQRAKTGDYNFEGNAKRMKDEFVVNNALDKYEQYLAQLHQLIENVKIALPNKPEGAEVEYKFDINDYYCFKAKIDADYGYYMLDHKTKTSFTPKEEWESTYGQQAKLYQYAKYMCTGEKQDICFLEIKKGKAIQPTKKDDLLAKLPEEQRDIAIEKGYKVDDIKAMLHFFVSKEEISQEIWFKWDDSIIERAEKLINKAIKKADWLKSLDIDDIL